MTKPIFDSRQYWRQRAKNQIRLNEALKGHLNQALADYDQVEDELRGVLQNCTCSKGEKP